MRVRHTFNKFWWDEELSLLKENSIKTHKLWTSLDKPHAVRGYILDNVTS